MGNIVFGTGRIFLTNHKYLHRKIKSKQGGLLEIFMLVYSNYNTYFKGGTVV